MTTITGNTYPVRRELRALCGIWMKYENAWLVPDQHAEEAKRLVANAATHYREKPTFNARDHSSHEDRCCGDAAYEDRCAEQCGPGL